ncbi:fatty acid desaturase [Calothrix rhizosoleniae]|uniref:fatty acid desaturase n=1 Tax=Calothrix rhizosoleniae TaxID=888997 RepID=UPI000B49D700|nr:fatty acid desaturase [Calothrix rhizosoleniae]
MFAEKAISLKSQPQWIQQGVKLGNAYHYRQKKTAIHNSLNIAMLILILAFAGSLLYLGTVLEFWLYIPLGAVGLGWVYFMLFILVVHEASHNMFILRKNLKQARAWNRCCGLLVCIPFGTEYIKHWEVGHQIHHGYPVEPQDPQNCPETVYTGNKLFKYLAKVLFIPGYAILRIDYSCPAEKAYGSNWQLTLSSVIVWFVSMSLETILLDWQVALASFLGIQVLIILNTIKITIEHGGAVGCRNNYWLRSCSSFFPLRKILMPFNISLHFEHHLNYCVPWYDLIKYHQQMEVIVPPELQQDVYKFNGEVWQQINS